MLGFGFLRHVKLGDFMNDSSLLMAGKRGLIMGVANERSLAWGIARATAKPAPTPSVM